ncbi:unnamed protein product [Angiostrongylus costaricensis]|uniref:Uncharacterized protein n=1 Tax=Angiostrongylus costaricensis TaxID=334426 RepID=A0A0R3PDT5_ANGCS|nr:unnamed protein product [Angiostrongylus costaricensis]
MGSSKNCACDGAGLWPPYWTIRWTICPSGSFRAFRTETAKRC